MSLYARIITEKLNKIYFIFIRLKSMEIRAAIYQRVANIVSLSRVLNTENCNVNLVDRYLLESLVWFYNNGAMNTTSVN